ncbi:MAG: hypothetical protein QM811_25815 [Pirellulales bacterium]
MDPNQKLPPPVPPQQPAQRPTTDRETYNIVTDTVIGPNLRLMDNLVQAGCIAFTTALGGGIGALVVKEWCAGLAVGCIAGLIVGTLGSGIALMVYRAIRHSKGKHD